MTLKLTPLVRFSAPAVPALAFLLAAAPVVAGPSVLSVIRTAGGGVDVTITSAADSYYILWRDPEANLSQFDAADAMKFGTGNPLTLTSAANAAPAGFYRVEEVSRGTSRDLDADGMTDVFELTYPSCLNPMSAADAALDCDRDGVSNLQESINGTDPTQPPAGTVTLVINEVDYDQIGTDTGEFLEIYNASAAEVSLQGLALVFVNGNGNQEYRRVDLSPAGSLIAGQYLVVGATTVLAGVPITAKTLEFPVTQDAIQNGSPDGVALINVSLSTVIDALSYEGEVTAASITGFTGPVSLVEGTALPVATADSNSSVGSLVRLPNGTDTNNAASDWAFTATITPGRPNP